MKTLHLILIPMSIAFLACAKQGEMGVQGSSGPQGPSAPIATPTPSPVVDAVQVDISSILADENTYRTGLGQTSLSNGLSCTLYTFTSGDRIQATAGGHTTLTGYVQVASFTYSGVFNQPDAPATDGLNALPSPLRSVYKTNYMLRCQGYIVVTSTAYYSFELTSDDASLLYIDGAKVIDNDNGHSATTVTGSMYLRRAVHSFRLDYAQLSGNESLVLTSGGVLVDGKYYAH